MNRVERILLGGAMFWWFGEGLLGPLFAIFAGEVGGDILDITWAWAIFLFVTGILEIFVGRLADKIGYERLMLAGFALNAFFTFCYLFIDSVTGLFIVQAGLGVALALADPTWDALYAKHENPRKAGYIWGVQHGIETIITGIAVVIGGLILTNFSFDTLFFLMGTIQTVGTIYLAKILYLK